MPVARRSLPLALGLLLLALPANTLAEPTTGGAIHGTGTVSAFTVYRDSGEAFEGGAYRRNLVCLDCLIKLKVTTSSVVAFQNGTLFDITPGDWEVREFRGFFAYTPRGQGHIEFRIEGDGGIVKTS